MSRHPSSQDLAREARDRRTDRLRRRSAIMAKACLVVAGLLIIGMGIYWWMTPADTLFSKSGLPVAPPTFLASHVRLVGFAISMVPVAALVFGLFAARRCFAAFAEGNVFSREAIGGLRAFAFAVTISALLTPLAGAGLSLLLSASSQSPTRSIVLNVGSDSLLALFFAAMIAIIAWVLSEAAEIADENQQFV